MTREPAWLKWLGAELGSLRFGGAAARVRMKVHLTGAKPGGEEAAAALHARVGVAVEHGRPSWPRLFHSLSGQLQGEEVGVFVCGGAALAADVETECRRSRHVGAPRYQFHSEMF